MIDPQGVVRIGAVLPLLLFSWVAGAVSLHLQAWELLPSASADFSGPSGEAVSLVELDLVVGGLVELRSGATTLYEVRLLRRGGEAAPAEALERIAGGSATIELRERSEAGWFASAGWRLELSRAATWELSVVADEVDSDLRGLAVRALSVEGDGKIRLGVPAEDLEVTVAGDLRVVIPTGTAAEVDGQAVVPPSWEETETGARFEAPGPIIRITSLGTVPIKISHP